MITDSQGDEYTKKLLNNLFFCLQPIIREYEGVKINEYEILLREKKNQNFPKDEFEYLSQDNRRNEMLMAWSYSKIKRILELNSQWILWVNISPQQLTFKSTYLFLENLKKSRKNIKIEITEQLPNNRVVNKTKTIKCIADIKKLGYELALDDIGSGCNTLPFVLENIMQIKRVKLSLVPLRLLSQEATLLLIKFWKLVADEAKLEFVVEGIDSDSLNLLIASRGVKLQQGFLWQDQFKFFD